MVIGAAPSKSALPTQLSLLCAYVYVVSLVSVFCLLLHHPNQVKVSSTQDAVPVDININLK